MYNKIYYCNTSNNIRQSILRSEGNIIIYGNNKWDETNDIEEPK